MLRWLFAFTIVLPLALAGAACSSSSPATTPTAGLTPQATASTSPAMTLTSTAFTDGASIPVEYTCDGANTSPPLAWTGAPSATRAFALLMEDPDAPSGTFVHWVLYDLTSGSSLPAAVATDAAIATQGENSAGRRGYTGPCPPRGSMHHYRFTLFALDAPTGLLPGAPAAELRSAIEGHTLATATLTGTFGH
jgi:Raf kinase inhibitor-like YbhB/YbcL family protein